MKSVFRHASSRSRRGPSAAGQAALAAGLALSGAGCLAQSDAPATAPLRFSGFGTLGLLHADAPEGWAYRRDIGQPGSSRSIRADVDSRLGLQLNYAATAQIEFVGQLLATRRSPYAEGLDSVEWAFAAFRPRPEWAVRIGRVSLDQFLLSDYRNVGFAYADVRPPIDFYGSIPSRLDGADVARTWNVGGAQWRVKGFFGHTHTGDLQFDANLLVKPAYGMMMSREADGLLVRASVSRATLGALAAGGQTLNDAVAAIAALPVPSVADEAAALRRRLDYSHTITTYAALSLSYEVGAWQFMAEATRVDGHPLVSFDSAYGFVARHFGPFTGYGGLSGIWTPGSHVVATPAWAATLAPVLGAAGALQAQHLGTITAETLNKGIAHQHTVWLGVRWDVQPQLALKLQWDHVDTGEYGGRLWAGSTDASAHSNVASVALDFVF